MFDRLKFLKKWTTLLGGIFIHFSIGSLNTFPILSTYLTSYLREISSCNIRYSTSGWISTTNTIVLTLSTFLTGLYIFKFKPNLKLIISVGCLIFCLGNGLSYFSIKESFLFTIFTYGILNCIGAGICYLTPLDLAMKWFPRHKGLINAAVLFGFSAGGILFNIFEVQFINPNNYSPDKPYSKEFPDEKYFSKEMHYDLLLKVPKFFLFSSIIFTICQLIGSTFIFEFKISNDAIQDSESIQYPDTNSENNENFIKNETNSLGVRYNDSNEGLTLKEIIRLPSFYVILSMLINFGHAPHQIVVYFKTFGQTWIEDDAFFSLIGSLASVAGAIGGLFWGFLIDKFSIKLCYLMMSSAAICLVATIYLTKLIGIKEIYLIWVCALFFVQSGNSVLIPTLVAKCYGQKNFTSIFGLMYMSTLPVAFLDTFINATIDSIGWFWYFFIGCCLSMLGEMFYFFNSSDVKQYDFKILKKKQDF